MTTVIEREVSSDVSDDESVNEPANEPVNEPANEPANEPSVSDDFSDIASKTVKKLSSNERARLISDFEKGIENPYFKVMRMKNGQIRVTKRREALCSDVNKAHEQVGERIEQRFNKGGSKHLTNEQLLMEHIIDLETRYEKMRMKHKKLKKRYNALENTIYDDDDVPQDITPRQQPVAEPVAETHDEPVSDEPEPETPTSTTPAREPVRRVRTTRSSWRNLVSYM